MKIAILGLLVLLLTAGCRESAQPTAQADNITFELVAIEPAALAVGDSQLSFLVQESGAPLANAQVAVRGDMNHAGMVPVEGSATSGADGIAVVPFEWTMGGEWIVTVTITTPGGLTVTGSFDMQIPA